MSDSSIRYTKLRDQVDAEEGLGGGRHAHVSSPSHSNARGYNRDYPHSESTSTSGRGHQTDAGEGMRRVGSTRQIPRPKKNRYKQRQRHHPWSNLTVSLVGCWTADLFGKLDLVSTGENSGRSSLPTGC